jgi:hypothetical protein
MKASGPDPLSDFLFNVREGHCEYFSTAMAVMVRTLGMPARVVNGFLPGEYNAAAGAYTVRQSDAHSWVEVYFPETDSWITFDPTPAAGRLEPQRTGVTATIGKYAEALELMWYQYVVGYDKQEQRSLAISFNNRLSDFRRLFANAFAALGRAQPTLVRRIPVVLAIIAAISLILFFANRVRSLGWRRAFRLSHLKLDTTASTIEFYERMLTALARRGIRRSPDQTPMEFAAAFNMIEAMTIIHAYNRVRFGREQLSLAELKEIESSLANLEATAAK